MAVLQRWEAPIRKGPFEWVIGPIGVIARRKGLQESGRMIHVTVRGEVVMPGSYEVPEGTTILEAINKAGGFTGEAFTREIRVSVSEQKYKISGKSD